MSNRNRTIAAADLQERLPPRATSARSQPCDKCDCSGDGSEIKSCCWETGECSRAFLSCPSRQSEVTFAAERR